MNKLSKWAVALSLLATSVAPLSTARAQTPPGQPTDFAIMMYGAAPGNAHALQRVKDCGINIAGFATPAQLDMVQAAGLKAFYWPPANEMETAMKDPKIAGHPALAGFLLESEFGASKFPELAKWVAFCKQVAPTKVPLINLLPTMAATELLETKNYQEFIDKYVDKVKPPVLCYDHYALMEDGTVDPSYWESLEVIRKKSVENNIPFWNIVLASAHMRFREPSAADFRFQAYTTMAYGGKGIVYFTYTAFPVGNHRGAPVDQFGDETASWQWLQNTNKQVLALAPIMMKLKSDEVYHFGTVPPAGHGPSAKSLIRDMGGNFMVGDFTHEDGSRYVMMVNKDLQKSDQCWPKFREDLVESVQKISIYKSDIPFENYEERFLAPGQGMLLKVKTK
jgi:hypothetical protein